MSAPMPGMPGVPGENPPTAPAKAGDRRIAVSARAIDAANDAITGALRFVKSFDAMMSARDGAEAVVNSILTARLIEAQRLLTGATGDSPPERVDTHSFTAAQLTQEFVNELMLERGWDLGLLLPGSAQMETLARRMLHEATDPRVSKRVKLIPAGERSAQVGDTEGWMLLQGSSS